MHQLFLLRLILKKSMNVIAGNIIVPFVNYTPHTVVYLTRVSFIT